MTATPLVSIVVPAFNEAELLDAHLDRIVAQCEDDRLAYEVVVVDDGSVDATRAIALRAAERHAAVRVVGLDSNRGLGGALRAGFAACRAPVVVTLDADLTYAPDHVRRLLAACTASTAVVIASPYADGGQVSGVPRRRLAVSRLANRLLERRTGLATSTSMVRAYDRAFLDAVLPTIDDRDLLLGLLHGARARGAAVVEIPAHLDWRAVAGRRSRLRTRDSVRAVVRAWRGRL